MDDFATFVDRATALLDNEVELTIRQAARADFPSEPLAAADALVTSLGYARLGNGWFDLDKEGADPTSHLADILTRDLVGHNFDWLTPSDARACASEFDALFRHGKVVRLANRIRNEWNPITSSTVEAAFVTMDDLRIGIFLIEAED